MTVLLCLPVKLRINPFSLSNAEQEIYSGPATEFAGLQLAMRELAHGLEWVALTGLVACPGLPRTGSAAIDIVRFAGLSLVVVVLLSAQATGTARLKIAQAAPFYWKWGMGMALVSMILAIGIERFVR